MSHMDSYSMNRKWFSFGLFQKIVLVFMAAIIPILGVGYLIVSNGKEALRQEIEQSLRSRVHFYLTELTRELEHIVELKRQYIFDQDIQRLITLSPVMNDYERSVEILGFQKKMQTLKLSSSYIQDVGLYLISENKVIYPNRIAYSIPDQATGIHLMLNKQSLPVVKWNDQLMMVERFPTGTYVDSLPAYWIEVVLNSNKMESVLAQILTESGGNALLSDVEGKWLLSGNETIEDFLKVMTVQRVVRFSRRSRDKRVWL